MARQRRRFVWEIDWNLLRTFMVIVQERGLTAAGEKLSLKQPTVSNALKRLETDHLVVSYPRRGTFATVVDVTELGAISDLRKLLEPHAARRRRSATAAHSVASGIASTTMILLPA